MKKYLSFFIGALLLLLSTVNAQYVTIPDSAFRSQLIINYPSCFNGAGQMDTTCSAIVNEDSLAFSFFGNAGLNTSFIQNIEGLRYFKNLQSLGMASLNVSDFPFLASKTKIHIHGQYDHIFSS